jgi:hypothetical protein
MAYENRTMKHDQIILRGRRDKGGRWKGQTNGDIL